MRDKIDELMGRRAGLRVSEGCGLMRAVGERGAISQAHSTMRSRAQAAASCLEHGSPVARVQAHRQADSTAEPGELDAAKVL